MNDTSNTKAFFIPETRFNKNNKILKNTKEI